MSKWGRVCCKKDGDEEKGGELVVAGKREE